MSTDTLETVTRPAGQDERKRIYTVLHYGGKGRYTKRKTEDLTGMPIECVSDIQNRVHPGHFIKGLEKIYSS